MTHTASHIVISKLRQTVSFGASEPPPAPGKLQVWHVATALLLVGLLAGLAI